MKQLLLLIVFVLIGCSAPQEQTQSTFKVGIRSLAAESVTAKFPGGLVLYGVSGDKSFSRVMTAETQDEVIPNGNWNFYVLGWEADGATGAAMTGKVYCGQTIGVELMGDPVEINISATNGNCSQAPFGAYDAGGAFKFDSLGIQSCSRFESKDDTIQINTYNDICNYDPINNLHMKGAALSFKLVASPFDRLGSIKKDVTGPKLEVGCFKVNTAIPEGSLETASSALLNEINIPVAGNLRPWSFKLRAYYGSDNCVDTYGYKDISFPVSQDYPHVKVLEDATNNHFTLFPLTTPEEVCASPHVNNMDGTVFKGGLGTVGAPYIVCRPKDLLEIDGATLMASNYILGIPINLNPLTAVLDPSNPPFPCAEGGDTFKPIGGGLYDHDADPDTKCEPVPTVQTFSGIFDGNNKHIAHLRAQGGDRAGFISSLSGSLMNIKFKDVELSGDNFTGIVGDALAGSVIQNVNVRRADIEGNNHVGSIVGRFSGNTLQTVYADQVKVRSEGGSNLGGVAGSISAGNASRLYFKGIISSYDSMNSTGFGGIVGYSTVQISEAASYGALITMGTKVGGIVGELAGDILNAHSSMVVKTYAGGTAYLGGIVGVSTGNVSNSYFSGQVSCAQSCTEQGGIFGSGATLLANVFETSLVGNTTLSDINIPEWKPALTGRYPKLDFEPSSRCDEAASNEAVADQKNAHGRGSAENPVVICNKTQFAEFSSSNSAGEYYILGDSIGLGIHASSDMNGLNGIFDGRGHIISNIKIHYDDATSSIEPGLFSAIDTEGVIKDVSLFVSEAISDYDINLIGFGALASKNSGLVENVYVDAELNHSNMFQNVGIIIGENSGTIKNTKATGRIVGEAYLGGLVAKNNGVITNSQARVDIDGAGAPNNLGGLVAYNNGIIEQSKSEGNISTAGMTHAGGLGLFVGFNDTEGSISNSLVDHAQLSIENDGGAVGGFVGANDGSISKSYTLGKVVTNFGGGSAIGGFSGVGSAAADNLSYFKPMTESFNGLNGDSYTCASNELTITSSAYSADGDFTINEYVVFNHGEDVAMTSYTPTSASFPMVRCHSFSDPIYHVALYTPAGTANVAGTVEVDYGNFKDINTFLAHGWNIAEFIGDGSGYREDDLVNYHLNRLTGEPIADPYYVEPIWEIDDKGAPRLLGLKDL